MKSAIFSSCVLLGWTLAAVAETDVFEGKFITEENGEFAVLTLLVEGSDYTGSILLDGYASKITAKRRREDLRGELHERDGTVYRFVARRSGNYLIMEFDDGALIVFQPDESEENKQNGR